jgi:trafficking protein particle complex subunit 3
LEKLQNAEVLTLTYGSIVRQLIADYDDVDEVNKQLEKMYVNPFSL